MAWQDPSVRATGDLITASIWNADIVGNLDYLYDNTDPFAVGDYKVSAQTAAHGRWLLCDAGAESRTTYATLFALIGTLFGVGDGSTTFNKPDPFGRVLVIKGTAHVDTNELGDSDGNVASNRSPRHNSTNSLTLPNHVHPANSSSAGGGATTAPQGFTNMSAVNLTTATGNPTTNPAIGGSIGPGGTLPVDTPAYLVVGNLFIHY
ncbi:MAG: tail fiber protein [Gemmatimonadaceae bacterium]|nr:tail fiber protein [Gemmatimonadaceae bacterium]